MINAPYGRCKTTRLELGDSIQAHGVLIVVEQQTGFVRAVSANAGELLGGQAEAMPGMPVAALLGAGTGLELLQADAPGADGFNLQRARFGGVEHLVAQHLSGPHLIVEIEWPPAPETALRDRLLSHGVARLGTADTPQATGEALMELVAALSGFDRVLLFRFLPDWHGQVVAEIVAPGMDRYLGLHFPESDMPANARRVCLHKKQRLIADVDGAVVPVIGETPGFEVDLGRTELQAVHPVHLQYLRNMGVRASFSVSVLAGDRLWGLVACHHWTPKRVPFALRQLADHLASVAAIRIGDLSRLEVERERHALGETSERIVTALQLSALEHRAVKAQLDRACRAYRAQSAWARVEGCDHGVGELPAGTARTMLAGWLSGLPDDRVTALDRVPLELAGEPDLVRLASGMLYLPLPRDSFVLLLRAEQVETVEWAGAPQPVAVAAGADTTRGAGRSWGGGEAGLAPRSSFAIWREQVRGAAVPWRETDVEGAVRLRELLLDFVDQRRLERMAHSDPLTGLANWLLFERRLDEAVAKSAEGGAPFALMMIDLVARLGGDEFAVLSRAGPRDRSGRPATARCADEAFRHRRSVGDDRPSIGAAICPLYAREPGELAEKADQALYRAKHEGRGRFVLFKARASRPGRASGH